MIQLICVATVAIIFFSLGYCVGMQVSASRKAQVGK